MDDRQPFTLTPEDLTSLRELMAPHHQRVEELKSELETAQLLYQNTLAGFLVGRGLKGRWNINFDIGEMNPIEPVGLALVAHPNSTSGDPVTPKLERSTKRRRNVAH